MKTFNKNIRRDPEAAVSSLIRKVTESANALASCEDYYVFSQVLTAIRPHVGSTTSLVQVYHIAINAAGCTKSSFWKQNAAEIIAALNSLSPADFTTITDEFIQEYTS